MLKAASGEKSCFLVFSRKPVFVKSHHLECVKLWSNLSLSPVPKLLELGRQANPHVEK